MNARAAAGVHRISYLGVPAEPEVTWLGLSRDKAETFTKPPWWVPPDALPRTAVGGAVRPCPGSFSMGLAPDGTRLFLYLVSTASRTTFRTFLTRHLTLVCAVPTWRLRLLIPRA